MDRVLRLIVITSDMHRVRSSVDMVETNANYGFNPPWRDGLRGDCGAQPSKGRTDTEIAVEQFRTTRDLWIDRMLVRPLRGPTCGSALDPSIVAAKAALADRARGVRGGRSPVRRRREAEGRTDRGPALRRSDQANEGQRRMPIRHAALAAAQAFAAPAPAQQAAAEAMQEDMMFAEYESAVIPPQQIDQSVFETAFCVDTRDEGQIAGGAIPGAVNIAWRQVLDRVDAIPEDRRTIPHRNTGSHSAQAAFAPRVARRSNVLVTPSGIEGWRRAAALKPRRWRRPGLLTARGAAGLLRRVKGRLGAAVWRAPQLRSRCALVALAGDGVNPPHGLAARVMAPIAPAIGRWTRLGAGSSSVAPPERPAAQTRA